MRGAGRVVLAEVQRVEVEPLGLDLGSLGHLVAHRDEDVGDPLGQRGQRVPGAAGTAVPGQRDVDGLLDEHPRVALGAQRRQPGVVRGLRRGERLVEPAAGGGPLGRRQRADVAAGQPQRRAVAQVRRLRPGQRVELRRPRRRPSRPRRTAESSASGARAAAGPGSGGGADTLESVGTGGCAGPSRFPAAPLSRPAAGRTAGRRPAAAPGTAHRRPGPRPPRPRRGAPRRGP